ncbi:MAG: addiction module protein [Desulfobulbaceae bacterium]|nr:addiction module protein [Desulfobulbaceae bacterium]
MNPDMILREISKLSIAQRILLLENAWDNIRESGGELPVPQWQQDELDRRLEEHYADPDADNAPAEDFHAELRKSL